MRGKQKPKFRVGQVVAVIGANEKCFEKIESHDRENEEYLVDSGYFSDYDLRPLTAREIGPRPRGKGRK